MNIIDVCDVFDEYVSKKEIKEYWLIDDNYGILCKSSLLNIKKNNFKKIVTFVGEINIILKDGTELFISFPDILKIER